jgi:two-component system phosphate regulon sensor histidine kinase PhoR
LNIIQRHTHRLTLLIEDLLVLSQLESGRLVMKPQSVRLYDMVTSVLEDLSAQAAARKAVLHNQVPVDLDVWADPNRLPQVLFNLMDNAIKYGRLGGTVTISARRTNGGATEVCVQDDGPGIPPEAIDRVFERFYRVDKARSREQGGTGLGLAIVKHIVQSHGGRVWVESQLDHGAGFYFILPHGHDARDSQGDS